MFGGKVEELGDEGKLRSFETDEGGDLAARPVIVAADLAAASGKVVAIPDQLVAFRDEVASLATEVGGAVLELLRTLVGSGAETLGLALRSEEAGHRRDVDAGRCDGGGELTSCVFGLAEIGAEAHRFAEELRQIASCVVEGRLGLVSAVEGRCLSGLCGVDLCRGGRERRLRARRVRCLRVPAACVLATRRSRPAMMWDPGRQSPAFA